MIQPLFTEIEKSNNNDIIVDDDPGIFHVFEMRIRLNEFDHRILALLKQPWERPERHLNPDFCKAGAVLYQLSYQANWELVVMWDDYKPEHVQGVKLTFFPGSHLAPKYFKVVANSKKLVAMTHTQNHFYPVTVLDRLNCSWVIVIQS